MQVALRIGNLDPVLVELVPDNEQQWPYDIRATIHRVVYPESNFDIYRTVRKVLHVTDRLRILQYTRYFGRCLQLTQTATYTMYSF